MTRCRELFGIERESDAMNDPAAVKMISSTPPDERY